VTPAERAREARKLVEEAAARILMATRRFAGPRFTVPLRDGLAPSQRALRWCLLAEGAAAAIGAAAPRAAASGAGARLRFAWGRLTDRWPADPAWERSVDDGGVLASEESLRLRIGAASAAFLARLEREAADGFPRRARHAAFGALDAADWAEALLIYAADAERRLLRAASGA